MPADRSKPMTFTAAMLDFFGRLPGQNAGGFAAELKALTDDDRAYFRRGLEQNGYTITVAANAA